MGKKSIQFDCTLYYPIIYNKTFKFLGWFVA